MSLLSVSRTTTAKLDKPTSAVPASAENKVAKQGEHPLEHDGVKAVIQFAQQKGQWIAEFRFRVRCGAFHAGTMPLTINSEQHANLKNALHSAASRMVAAMAVATNGHQLNKRQHKAAYALTVRECARMQGFHESFTPHARPGIAKRQFGNSVAVPVVAAIAEQLSKSIR